MRSEALYLGLDVGSVSTNVVVINEAGKLLAKKYLRTQGQPIKAIREGLVPLGAALTMLKSRVWGQQVVGAAWQDCVRPCRQNRVLPTRWPHRSVPG